MGNGGTVQPMPLRMTWNRWGQTPMSLIFQLNQTGPAWPFLVISVSSFDNNGFQYSREMVGTIPFIATLWIKQIVKYARPRLVAPTVYPKKYAHGFRFAVLCCGYTLTDFPISIRLTSLALWQSNDCPSASKVTLMNMDKYFMWIHYERLHNHNKIKHNKTVCIFLGIYCICS